MIVEKFVPQSVRDACVVCAFRTMHIHSAITERAPASPNLGDMGGDRSTTPSTLSPVPPPQLPLPEASARQSLCGGGDGGASLCSGGKIGSARGGAPTAAVGSVDGGACNGGSGASAMAIGSADDGGCGMLLLGQKTR